MATQREKYNKWTWWVAILLAVLLLLMWIFGCGGKICCSKEARVAEPVEATFDAGTVGLMGAVASQADRDALVNVLSDRYGASNLSTQLVVDPELGEDAKQTLVLKGAVESQEVADQMVADLRTQLPHYTIDNQLTIIPAPVSDAANVVCGDTLALAVRFDTGSAALQDNDRALLDVAAKCIEQKYEVQGHTDSQGELEMNMELSQERADAVQTYLIEKGVAADLLSTKAFGPNQPIASNQSEYGRSMNRRIELRMQP